MKCPRCGLEVSDASPRCEGCGFSLADLDGRAGVVPVRDGPLYDPDGRLSSEERDALLELLEGARKEVHGDIVVALLGRAPILPATYAFWLFNRWQVGGDQHAGLLVLVDFDARRVECEVGYAWEPVLDEEATGAILDENLVPALADGRMADGLGAGLGVVVERLRAVMGGAA